MSGTCAWNARLMSSLSIKTLLVSIILFLGLLFAGTSVLSWRALHLQAGDSAAIAKTWLPAVSTSQRMETLLYKMRMNYLIHVTASKVGQKKAAVNEINTASADLDAAIADYRPMISSDKEKMAINNIEATTREYRKRGEKVLALSTDGKTLDALSALSEMRMMIAPAVHDIQELVNLNRAGANTTIRHAEQTLSTSVAVLLVASGVVLVLVLGATAYVFRGIASPIQQINGAMKILADGNTESTVPYLGRKDEIGRMAASVETFRKRTIKARELEANAAAARRQAEEERIEQARRAEADARDVMLQATSGLASGLKRLAAGDLSFQIDEPFAADFESLRHDLNDAIRQLASTLSDVFDATRTIDSGSNEVSRSAQDLARRTEQQAASLEETAAALDEITANVTNSSKRAEEARALAGTANTSAKQSEAVVTQAIGAMGRIEAASSQIASIISVIDSIAFQTNLLALNAGVEAARAGEAGKGFAVVAMEVRELAQRSAGAAKEIRDLIKHSEVEVQNGVKLVRDTGEALTAIEALISSINDHMVAIATASREQSVGLAEVNTSVNLMDQVTQQNAAMVEETSAAGSALALESNRLQNLVSRFQLNRDYLREVSPQRMSA